MNKLISRIRVLFSLWLPTRDQWEELQKLVTTLAATCNQAQEESQNYKRALQATAEHSTDENARRVARYVLDGYPFVDYAEKEVQ